MKILFISKTADGLGIAQRLSLEGHDVAVWIKDPIYARCGKNIVDRPTSWREKLLWADLVIGDMVGQGDYEKVIKKFGKPMLGFNPIMDLMELDRGKGMEIFQKLGIQTPETWGLTKTEDAQKIIAEKGWGDGVVLKPDDNIGTAQTMVLKEEMELDWALGEMKEGHSFIMQRIVSGVEVSTEGWFNGRDFITPFNHTFEEKRLMDKGLGPNTGCMGNVIIARESNKLTKATVERLKPFLAKVGYRGPVDVNTIVNKDGAFALEATCRFGYDAIEGLFEGLKEPAIDLLYETAMGTKKTMDITTDTIIVVRLCVPPYPEENIKAEHWGDPILGIGSEALKHIFLCNVFLDTKDNLVKTADADGIILKASARGPKNGEDYVKTARDRVYRTLNNCRVSNKMYRTDIGLRVNADMKKLIEWGWVQA